MSNGATPVDKDKLQRELLLSRKHGAGAGTTAGDWASLSPQQQQSAAARGYDQAKWDAERTAGMGRAAEAGAKEQLGDQYIEPGQSRPRGAPPVLPDETDALLRQRRAAEMNRLMLGFGRGSTFTQGGMGDLKLGKKMLTGGS